MKLSYLRADQRLAMLQECSGAYGIAGSALQQQLAVERLARLDRLTPGTSRQCCAVVDWWLPTRWSTVEALAAEQAGKRGDASPLHRIRPQRLEAEPAHGESRVEAIVPLWTKPRSCAEKGRAHHGDRSDRANGTVRPARLLGGASSKQRELWDAINADREAGSAADQAVRAAPDVQGMVAVFGIQRPARSDCQRMSASAVTGRRSSTTWRTTRTTSRTRSPPTWCRPTSRWGGGLAGRPDRRPGRRMGNQRVPAANGSCSRGLEQFRV